MIMSSEKEKANMIYKLNSEKHVSTIISFYIFLSRQCSLLYIYLVIISVFKYLLPYLRMNKVIYIII